MAIPVRHGDVVWRWARTPGLQNKKHYAVVDRINRVVIENTAQGVVETPLRVFLTGGPVFIVVRLRRPGSEQVIVDRARTQLGRSYSLLLHNCEHLATYAATGQATSPQVREAAFSVGLVSALVGLVAAAANAPTYDANVDRYRDRKGRFT